jgi:hypothetical protein
MIFACRIFTQLHRDIEQCYPNQADAVYGNWRKTQAEIDALNPDGKKNLTGHKKKQLAKFVGDNISQVQFETEMPETFAALQRCWALTF